MRYFLTVFICKIFIFALHLMGKKGTSAPGKLAYRLYPGILREFEKKVKKEIIAVMGTNGKTTTNNLLADTFENAGYSVVCNRVGANMDEGSVVAFIEKCNIFGKINVDYACLEMDEGWAEYIFKMRTPHKIVITNLFRDQLDRYGEIDITMSFLKRAIALAPKATLILNGDDPLTTALAMEFKNKKLFYGIENNEFNTKKQAKEGKFCHICGKALKYEFYHFSQLGKYACACGFNHPELNVRAKNVTLFPTLSFEVEGSGKISLNGRGKYNIYNLLAVTTAAVNSGTGFENVQKTAEDYKPQAGRLERFEICGKNVYLLLAKNPASFNQSVEAVMEDPSKKDIIIAINDGIGDGKDVSWLWDVDFEDLISQNTTSYSVSGTRYGDMGLRFKYAGLSESEISLSPDIKARLSELIKSGKGESIYVLVNYTALFSTQAVLKELGGEVNGN